jgi:hypothetical protein
MVWCPSTTRRCRTRWPTTTALAVSRLARRRLAFFVPLIGCAAQLALGIGAAAMEMLAGPVS